MKSSWFVCLMPRLWRRQLLCMIEDYANVRIQSHLKWMQAVPGDFFNKSPEHIKSYENYGKLLKFLGL